MRTPFSRLALAVAGIFIAGVAHANTEPNGRVIVKFSASNGVKTQTVQDLAKRTQGLAQSLNMKLTALKAPAPDLQVVSAEGISSEDLAARLRQSGQVEYAEPDRLRKHSDARLSALTTPTDPLFTQQWYLQDSQVAAMRLNQAWTTTTGAPIVVAVIDTGVRYDHEDLAGKLLPGYDFISEPQISNDGGGWDNDANDPGDWVSAEDAKLPIFSNASCGVSDSSWHGTHVASMIAAASNNNLGLAGVSWGAKILPVRTMGKCSGYDSDILAGMRWAAGLSVPGAPNNPNPAKIINLSLGGPGACSKAYTEITQSLHDRGVLLVVAAGNESSTVDSPANCPGVLAVAAIRNDGTKAGYSNAGPEVKISAPGGNCGSGSSGSSCQYPIHAASNAGTTTPGANSYSSGIGTSYATPLVAGVASLMWSQNSELTPDQLIARMQQSARPFPVRADLSACDPVTNKEICNCTNSTCGSGMVDAPNALAVALAPEVSFSEANANKEQGSVELTANTHAFGSQSVTTWQWTLKDATPSVTLSTPQNASTVLTVPSTGDYTVVLTVKDSAGNVGQSARTLHLEKTEPKHSGGGGGAAHPFLLLVLSFIAGLGAAFSQRADRAARL